MGERELQEALRRDAQGRIRQLWQAAEAAVAERRAAVGFQVAVLQKEAQLRLEAVVANERRTARVSAEVAVRQRRLVAEALLRERLYALAVRLLSELCGEERQRVWNALADELPLAEWQLVRVHPDDLKLARQRFPAAKAVGEATLGGGLVVETADSRIVVDNSLAGRLERSWAEVLTPLMAVIHEEVDKNVAGSAPTG